MRIDTKWRNWGTHEVPGKPVKSNVPQMESGGGKPPPDNPPEKKRPKKLRHKSEDRLKGPLQKKETNKHNTKVKEIPFYKMEEKDKHRVYDTRYPSMLDWSKDSGLDRGMVKIANDMNEGIHNGMKIRRLGNHVSNMIAKFAEDQCGNDIYPGNEFWDEDALLNRVMTKVPIHICRKDRELDKVILILDTSPSCSQQALLYANIARSVIGHGLVEMYDAPNAYITRKFCPVRKKFVEFMDADTIVDKIVPEWGHFKKRHIIFFGDTDGWRIVTKAMKNNTINWFMNIDGGEFQDYLGISKAEKLQRLPVQCRKRIYTNIYNTKDFIDTIKKLK